MSKPRRGEDYLSDNLEAMQRIMTYTGDLSYQQFTSNIMAQGATIRNLQVIGDATKKLSLTLRGSFPDIRWREMAGMRDKIVHEYFGINLEVVWEVARKDLPAVSNQIEDILRQR